MYPDDRASHPVFFIVGRARSGTTLLRSMLDNHPAVIVPPECPFVVNLYSRYHERKNWNARMLNRFYHDIIRQPSFDYLNADREKLRSDILASPAASSFDELCMLVYLNYRPPTTKENIRLTGDKNPHYSLFIKQLLSVFPDARFIHLIRDPRANVSSMMEVDFESPVPASLAWRWKYYNRMIEKQKAKHPERFYTLRYEDMVSEPEKYVREICAFLDIEYNKAIFDFYRNKDEILRTYPPEAVEKYHSSLFNPVSNSRVDAWKERLKPGQIRTIAAVTGDFALSYGYTHNETISIFRRISVQPGIFYGWLYMVWGRFISLLPYSLKMAVIHFMAMIFKPWWKKHSMPAEDKQ